eukprot:TCALIF_07368-PA protein Name:"Protein of unknown function" AED:0.43 eAED:1.00 QI:0/0/0/1/1/1/2/0/74
MIHMGLASGPEGGGHRPAPINPHFPGPLSPSQSRSWESISIVPVQAVTIPWKGMEPSRGGATHPMVPMGAETLN